MATRENQGLQAIIIVLTILFIGSLVGLLLVNNARKTAVAQRQDAETRAGTASTAQATTQSEANEYKLMMGYEESAALEAIKASFQEDMKRMGVDPAMQKFRVVLENIFEENRKLALNEASAKAEIERLKASLLAVEGAKEEQVKQFQAQMEQIKQDAAQEKANFGKQYASITTERDKLKADMEKALADHDTAIAALEQEKTQLDTQIAKLEQAIEKLRLGLPEVDQFAQPADGSITWVNQRYSTVWVDLGSADGLRPQVTFSVADAGLDDAAAAEKKGSIEITQILGPHRAEGRITQDDPTNPLQPGDRVFSQVWDRGRKVGFAIAGFIDIDKDGREDLDKLKSIIAASGGVVDAAPDATGKKEGAMRVGTRYLILGDYPEQLRLGDLRTSWAELGDEAEQLGIETIALDEFLSLMGWKDEARTVPLDATAQARDFPAQPAGQEMPRKPVQPSEGFKPRLPTAAY